MTHPPPGVLQYDGKRIIGQSAVVLTNEWTKQSMARAVPGAHYVKDEGWVVDNPDARSAAVICRLFPELQDVYPHLTFLRDELLRDARPFDNATAFDTHITAPRIEKLLANESCVRCAALLDGPEPDCPVCDGHPDSGGMYPFQLTDLGYIAAVLRKHSSAEIAWERGLGKTLAACSIIENAACDRVLIVAPNTAKSVVWEDELRRFLPDYPIRVMPNGQPLKMEALIQHAATTHEKLIVICHYEALKLVAETRSGGKGWARIPPWDIVVCDESHRLANNKTQMHRALMKVPCDWKLSLTGSMIQNHPEEFYGRLRWLFPKVYKSKWRDWNNRFLEYVESGYGKVLIGPRLDAIESMRQELGVFTVYRRKCDELDLPPKQEDDVLLDLNKKQRAAYDELRDSLVATLDSGEQIVGLQPIVLLTRLRQVATGLDLVSGTIKESAKMDWTDNKVADRPDDTFVIFSWYKAAAAAQVARLEAAGESVVMVTGDTTHKQRRDRIRSFQAGEARCFVGTISTLGESVNLHAANQGIFLDRSWNPAQNEQAADRLYRIGQKRPVTITDLIAKDTVDEYNVLPALNNKEAIRRMILGGR